MMAALAPGPAVVAVSVATLWRAPDRVRPVDAPALAVPPSVRAWAAALTPAQERDLHGRCDSQLLLGEPVLVEEVAGAWARVIATGQASSRHARGYPGWIPVASLAEGTAAAATHVVTALVAEVVGKPDGAVTIPDVGLGTALSASGPATGGWLPLALPGGTAGWIASHAVQPLPGPASGPHARDAEAAGAGTAALEVARQFLGVRYVWGGMSPFGIDCSGLVHLAYRRVGIALPRDAHDQAAVTAPVALGMERQGDAYLFARPGRPVHHIGLVAAPPDADGSRRMLHASGGRSVVAEVLSPERLATLVAVHRVVACTRQAPHDRIVH